MTRRIAVCDDEQDVSRQMSLYLKQIAQERSEIFDCFYYGSAEELLAHMPRDMDALLLDIGMAGITGMEAAYRLRREKVEIPILFITSMTEYALEGYEVHAFSFLSKPVRYASLSRNLSDAFAQIDAHREDALIVNDGMSRQIVDLRTLIYAEVYQHHTSFVFVGERRSCKLPLAEIEAQVLRRGFFRCHKSFLVNFRHISRIDFDSVTMDNNERVPLSKYRRKEFLTAYSRFMGV